MVLISALRNLRKVKRMKNDLISREALRKAFHYRIKFFNKSDWDKAMLIIDTIPATEERPLGEWIMNKTSARGRYYTCTNCKKVSRNNFDYCPMCGADMREGRQ